MTHHCVVSRVSIRQLGRGVGGGRTARNARGSPLPAAGGGWQHRPLTWFVMNLKVGIAMQLMDRHEPADGDSHAADDS